MLGVDDQAGQRTVHLGQIEQLRKGGLTGAMQRPFGDDLREAVAQEAGLGVGQFDQRGTESPDDGGAQVVVVGLGLVVDHQEGFVEAAQQFGAARPGRVEDLLGQGAVVAQ